MRRLTETVTVLLLEFPLEIRDLHFDFVQMDTLIVSYTPAPLSLVITPLSKRSRILC